MVVSYRHLLPRRWLDRECAAAIDVECVIDGKFFLQLLVVTEAHLLEAPRNSIEAAGFVHMIHTARTSPLASPAKMSSAERPGVGGICPAGIAQWRSTAARAPASATSR